VGETIRKAGGLKDPAPLGKEASEILHTGTLLLVAKESSKIPQSSSAPREREEGEGLFPERRLPGRASGAQDLIRIKIVRMEARKLLVFSIPLDLNRVAAEDLCFIPGIGTALAQEIVAYRTRRRGFRSVEELKNVKGIGEKKWKDLKPFFVVNAAPLPK
jgi:competence ComEA-like helix-hairpin-helix protein